MAAAICQFHQVGHCKFAVNCDKTHTPVTCDSFPCLDSECDRRHPIRCKYFDLYGRCRYAEQCSYLHFHGHDQAARTRNEIQMIVQEVAELKQKVETLRSDNERLVAELERCDRKVTMCCDDLLARVRVQDGKIKNIEEQAAVTRAMRGQEDNVTGISMKVDATSPAGGVREIVDKTGSKGGQVNPEKDFSCDQCSYKGTSRKGLKSHVTKKHRNFANDVKEMAEENEKVVNCPYCDYEPWFSRVIQPWEEIKQTDWEEIKQMVYEHIDEEHPGRSPRRRGAVSRSSS